MIFLQPGRHRASSKQNPEVNRMIQLTRLNKKSIVVNSDLIEFIENAPDTVITLVTGEKVVVAETTEEIVDRIIMFRRRLLPASLTTLPPVVLSSQDSMDNEPE